MLEIDHSHYFAQGLHRKCYVHPQNKYKVIKINMMHAVDHKETKREVDYYKHLERRGINWNMIPKYYGTEETTLGKGHVFDLIRDYDGHISKPLTYYLNHKKNLNQLPLLLRKAGLLLKSI